MGCFFVFDNKKKIESVRLIAEHEAIFACPLCSSSMKMTGSGSLICLKRHCFDIAKRGYVNLLPRAHKTKYDKSMFEAREKINESGLFEPLIVRICEIIGNRLSWNGEPLKLLDAGCGEGSHLINIQKRLAERAKRPLGVGIDISKDGIQLAARRASKENAIWCVADLANCPFAAQQFNYILNILSPSNYSEFRRMLAEDGWMLKVIPGSGHLAELRGKFYSRTAKDSYSNDSILELFKRNFELVETERVQYGLVVERADIEHLIRMTPLSWGVADADVQQLLGMNHMEITLDFTMLLGTRSS